MSFSDGDDGGAAASFSGDDLTLGTAGVAADWKLSKDVATSDRYTISKNGVVYVIVDPATSFRKIRLLGDGTHGVGTGPWIAADNTPAGSMLGGEGIGANQALVIMPDTSGTAGHDVIGGYYDSTATEWCRGLRWGHTAGRAVLYLSEDGGDVRAGKVGIATTATRGHFRFPTCAGVPTGVPDAGSGSGVVNSLTGKLYIYDTVAPAWLAQA